MFSKIVSHLELIRQDENDDLKLGPGSEGHLVQDLLSAPALFLQRVAHDARWLLEPRVEVKRHVGPRLHAAATREVDLEPARRSRGHRGEVPAGSAYGRGVWKWADHLSASDGTDPWMRTISPGSKPPRMVPAKGMVCGERPT